MGLDIFLYRLEKPTLNIHKTYKPDDLSEYTTVPVKESDLDQTIIDNFTQTVDVEYRFWDTEKIYNKFKETYHEHYSQNSKPENLEFDLTGSSYSEETSSFTWKERSSGRTVFIVGDIEDAFEKYTRKEKQPTYVFKTIEIDYQRKGLTEYGWELLPENCEYCMDYDTVQKLTQEGLSDTFIDNWVDGETALLAWW